MVITRSLHGFTRNEPWSPSLFWYNVWVVRSGMGHRNIFKFQHRHAINSHAFSGEELKVLSWTHVIASCHMLLVWLCARPSCDNWDSAFSRRLSIHLESLLYYRVLIVVAWPMFLSAGMSEVLEYCFSSITYHRWVACWLECGPWLGERVRTLSTSVAGCRLPVLLRLGSGSLTLLPSGGGICAPPLESDSLVRALISRVWKKWYSVTSKAWFIKGPTASACFS